jgi:hypothetical protein
VSEIPTLLVVCGWPKIALHSLWADREARKAGVLFERSLASYQNKHCCVVKVNSVRLHRRLKLLLSAIVDPVRFFSELPRGEVIVVYVIFRTSLRSIDNPYP